ncbi:copper resistance protein NlpE N-terminal domain-containing protein [Porticoccus sp.]|uniref:copper resistance protein NlpE N-terminal domain-containing protein n=1 Tax=Porticoccus sp. TaxID=2024853 RepID=UPI003F6A49C3
MKLLNSYNHLARLVTVLLLVLLGGCNADPDSEESNVASSKTSEPAIDQPARSHNSSNSLTWEGSYSGVLPCADCPGIDTNLVLHRDNTFSLTTRYLGEDDKLFESSGTFRWNEAGTGIRLQGLPDNSIHYQIGENQLIQLDKQGQRITGDLADQYVLKKKLAIPDHTPVAIFDAPKWQLTELLGKPVTSPESAWLTFEKQDGRVTGFGGCNNLAGNAVFDEGGKLHFSQMAGTRKACPDSTREMEFLQVLRSTASYRLDDKTLVLMHAKMAPLAKLEQR